jgi:transcriptional regulator with XRE-family HTH domain
VAQPVGKPLYFGRTNKKGCINMNVEIANRLVQLRKQSNLSQEELAMRLGISRQAVSKWERAESSPDTDNLIALASLYKMSLDDLVHSDLPPEPAAYTPPYQPETTFTAEVPTLDGSYYEVKGEEEEEKAKEPVKQEASDPLPEGSFYDTKEGQMNKESWLHQVPYPLFIVALYLVLGFIFHQWHPGWLVFMTIPIHYMPEKEKRMPLLLGNPVIISLAYLILGFYLNLWHPGWLIFLLIPIIQSTRGGKKIKNAENNTENS